MSLDFQTLSYIESLCEEFDKKYDNDYDLQDLHMEYILENYDPEERIICNGDTLIEAHEAGYLYEEFRESYIVAHWSDGR